MQVRKAEPPKSVERNIAVELTRDEVMQVLVAHIKTKLTNYPTRLEDIEVRGDSDGRLQSMELKGVEVIPLSWKSEKFEPQEK